MAHSLMMEAHMTEFESLALLIANLNAQLLGAQARNDELEQQVAERDQQITELRVALPQAAT